MNTKLTRKAAQSFLVVSFADENVAKIGKVGRNVCDRANHSVLTFVRNEPGNCENDRSIARVPERAKTSGITCRGERFRISAKRESCNRRNIPDSDFVHDFAGQLGNPLRRGGDSRSAAQYSACSCAFEKASRRFPPFPQKISAVDVHDVRNPEPNARPPHGVPDRPDVAAVDYVDAVAAMAHQPSCPLDLVVESAGFAEVKRLAVNRVILESIEVGVTFQHYGRHFHLVGISGVASHQLHVSPRHASAVRTVILGDEKVPHDAVIGFV